MNIYKNYSLLKHNTFHLNTKTHKFIEYESEEDLQKILEETRSPNEPIYHIGHGSNILFLNDFKGTIIHSNIKGIEIIKEDKTHILLKVGASEDWDSFVSYCVNKGWGGIENLSLIPGEIGASAFQNIGAYGAEISNVVEEVHAYSLTTKTKQIFSNKECKYSYRNSFFKESKEIFYITYVVYRLLKTPQFILNHDKIKSYLYGKEINLINIRKAIIAIRQLSLPNLKIFGNAGSFFTNPYICIDHYKKLKKQYYNMPCYFVDNKIVKVSAAWLIEQCGGKKEYIGGASVYEKHALILINKNNATGQDISILAEKIQSMVKNTFGIKLKPEVSYL
ncbi:MAG: UDP-N-acetylmuramate dehydrogenase [Bacteroidales bacterium OttesenSCG-928-I14]|jgi:UDP-N-acetylmuramate dehydrogenase|nr:UDP-N-acetylmuramate dehydrogenase [Bacteroidales bacterium OttesenSCG-928-I14]